MHPVGCFVVETELFIFLFLSNSLLIFSFAINGNAFCVYLLQMLNAFISFSVFSFTWNWKVQTKGKLCKLDRTEKSIHFEKLSTQSLSNAI